VHGVELKPLSQAPATAAVPKRNPNAKLNVVKLSQIAQQENTTNNLTELQQKLKRQTRAGGVRAPEAENGQVNGIAKQSGQPGMKQKIKALHNVVH